ncbi:MAG TPA: hypothetical protein VFG95_01560 [Nitrospiria bacterium]|nr:hypothetical protein [Nitrospiria bacterium]
MSMHDIWGYPYRLGIGLFITVGTAVVMSVFLLITVLLERHFKKEREKR